MNFMSNSLKFTNLQGTVTVDIKIINKQVIDDQFENKLNELRRSSKNSGKSGQSKKSDYEGFEKYV